MARQISELEFNKSSENSLDINPFLIEKDNPIPISDLEEKNDQIYPFEFFKEPSSADLFSTIAHKNLIFNESWDNIYNIHSRVIQITNSISCDCLIDKDERQFEIRNFPSSLFKHISNLNIGSFVIISIKTKIGTIKIDVYDGNKIVDKNIFKFSEQWEQDFSDFNEQLKAPIKL